MHSRTCPQTWVVAVVRSLSDPVGLGEHISPVGAGIPAPVPAGGYFRAGDSLRDPCVAAEVAEDD